MKRRTLESGPQRPRWRQAALLLALGIVVVLNWIEYGRREDVLPGSTRAATAPGETADPETAQGLQWPQRRAWGAMQAIAVSRSAHLQDRTAPVPALQRSTFVGVMPPPAPTPVPLPTPPVLASVVFLGHFQDGGGSTAFLLVGGVVQQLKIGDALPAISGDAGAWVVHSVSADQLVLRSVGQQDRVVRAGEGT